MSVVSPKNSSLLEKIRELPAWGASFLVHAIALVMLMGITYSTAIINEMEIVSSLMEEDEEQVEIEEYKFSSIETNVIGNDSDLNQAGPSLATAQLSGDKPETQMEERMEQEIVQIEVPQTTMLIPPSEAELTDIIDVAGETEHTGGVEGALDRITFEIATSLKQKPTLVIWILDASLSLEKRRLEIAKRFDNIYKQLGVMGADKSNPLKTALVSYGQNVEIITENPTSDTAEVLNKIKSIQPDTSGEEKVFTAVEMATNKWSKLAARQGMKVMLVIVTDERGDDIEKLDNVINTCKRHGMKAFCLGNASLFGRQIGYVRYKWKEGNQEFEDDLPVDSGPESLYPEQLNLAFWGNGRPELAMMSAEYGPYGLTRLCAETGGLFLLMDNVPEGTKFDFKIMRGYTPDYRPVPVLQAELQKNAAKSFLIEAIMTTQANRMPQPMLEFRADTDTRLRQEITDAQKPVAEMEYRLNEIISILKKGEKARATLVEPRWRASYDLAMGRALAMQSRFYGYNAMLADMKVAPKTFTSPKSNQWVLRPSKVVNGGISVSKLADEATKYLKRVIDEHEGTPWQLIAAQELSQPMGWEWKENIMFIPENMQMANPNNPNNPQFAPEEEQMRMQQNKPPEPKVRPKL